MNTIAIVQARMNSSRLPGKVLQDIAGHWEENFTSIFEINEFDSLSIADERIINPSLWSIG